MEVIGLLIVGIIQGCIWGFVTDKIIMNKGYYEDWFWWGFFFGLFAVIVAATKPDNNYRYKQVIESTRQLEKLKTKTQEKQKSVVTKLLSNNFTNKVDIKSPIHVISWNIQKKNYDLFLYIKFLNVSDSPITAVMFTVVGFNSFSDRIRIAGKEEFEVIGQDYNLMPGKYQTASSMLLSQDIRKVDIIVKKVSFSDGTVFEYNDSEFVDTNQEPLESKYLQCVKKESASGRYYSIIKQEYWQCVCGFVNVGEFCKFCSMKKDDAFKFTKNQIDITYNRYLKDVEEQRQKAEQERLNAEKKIHEEQERRKQELERIKIRRQEQKQKKIKVAVIGGCALVVVIIGIIVLVL